MIEIPAHITYEVNNFLTFTGVLMEYEIRADAQDITDRALKALVIRHDF